MRKQTLLDSFPNDNRASCQRCSLIIDVASISERVGIGREKTAIRAGDSESRRGLESVINRLPSEIETLKANLSRVAFHQLVIAQGLAVSDVATVLVFLLRPSAGADVRRIFGELKNVRAEKTDAAFDRALERANRRHDRDDGENADRNSRHGQGRTKLVRSERSKRHDKNFAEAHESNINHRDHGGHGVITKLLLQVRLPCGGCHA